MQYSRVLCVQYNALQYNFLGHNQTWKHAILLVRHYKDQRRCYLGQFLPTLTDVIQKAVTEMLKATGSWKLMLLGSRHRFLLTRALSTIIFARIVPILRTSRRSNSTLYSPCFPTFRQKFLWVFKNSRIHIRIPWEICDCITFGNLKSIQDYALKKSVYHNLDII